MLPKEVGRPLYDRSSLQAGIVHFGVGQFHRGHQAMYIDRLLRAGLASDWAICGVGLTANSGRVGRVLGPQDYLFSLVERPPTGEPNATVIGSLVGYLNIADGEGPIVSRIADGRTRIVTLTVTEGAYQLLDQGSGASQRWLTVLLDGLRARRNNGAGGISVVSCDNVRGNGPVARAALSAHASSVAPEMVSWIEREVAFPSSMVDRVVPRFSPLDVQEVEERFGYHDEWPITCEPFSAWFLEDEFAAGRPALEEAGVTMVRDVEPYETMKLRLANGAHQVLCYFGYLLGMTFVHEAIRDVDIQSILVQYMAEEAVPTLKPIADFDQSAWGAEVLSRFANPQLADPLARICEEASVRVRTFLLPVAHDQVKKGGPVRVCAAAVAAWSVWVDQVSNAGGERALKDPLAPELVNAVRRRPVRPTSFVEVSAVFGDLALAPGFRSAFTEALEVLVTQGPRRLLKKLAQRG